MYGVVFFWGYENYEAQVRYTIVSKTYSRGTPCKAPHKNGMMALHARAPRKTFSVKVAVKGVVPVSAKITTVLIDGAI